MTKSLSVSFEDVEQANNVQITGTLHPNSMNETVVISIGAAKIVVNSKDLQDALNEVTAFQSKFEVKS